MIKDNKLVITWCLDDVRGTAKEMGVCIDDAQAVKVLEYVDRYIDCELGVTWQTIECAIEEVLS